MGILALRPYKILVQNVIHYLDAGPDQYAICTNNITLTATVIGDLAGHVILWEQISGNTLGVTVTSPTNELTLTYTNTVPPGSFSDKTWRFWIDRGTPNERYSDVVVYGTPTDQIYESYNTSNTAATHMSFGPTYNCRCPVLSWGRNFPLTENLVGNGFGGCDDGTYQFLKWNVPCESNYLRDYTLQYRTSYTTWVNVATISKDLIMYTGPLIIGEVYRLIANYTEGNNSTGQYFSNLVGLSAAATNNPAGYYTTSEVVDKMQFVDYENSTNSNTLHNVSNYSTFLLTLHLFNAPTDFPADETYISNNNNNTGANYLNGYTVSLLTLHLFNAPTDFPADETYISNNNNNITTHLISNYTVTNTGGGSVGGP